MALVEQTRLRRLLRHSFRQFKSGLVPAVVLGLLGLKAI